MKKILKTVFVLIGTIIGAGFASGKEIYLFFFQYGFNGLIGIIISSIIFSYIIWKILKICEKQEIDKYEDFKINSHIKHIMTIFLLTTFYIMVAGFAAFLFQEFNIPYFIGSIIISSICYLTFIRGVDGIVKVNTILIPILIIILIHIFIQNVDNEVIKNIFIENKNIKEGNLYDSIKWLISCLEYVGYNSIIIIPILINLKNKKDLYNKISSILFGIIFAIMAIGIFMLLEKCTQSEINLEIPIIGIISKKGEIYKYILQIIIGIAIYTSAISAGYGFIQNTSINKEKNKKIIKAICISSIFISRIGFSYLVELLYPIFGLLGIIQIRNIIKLNKIGKIYKIEPKGLKKNIKTDINYYKK